MEFVEQHGGDAGELGIVEQHASEDAFGDDLDTGGLADPGFQPDAIADGLAHLLAERSGHEAGGGAGGEAAGLEQNNLGLVPPRGVEQGQRHAGGLTGARRGNQYGARLRSQGAQQRGQSGVDRKRH